MTFDVAILGGGPAGSLCAAMLRKQAPELSVVVLDKASFPRPTVGEVALPGWADLLDRVGVLDRVEATGPMRKLGVIFSWGPAEAGTTWTADFRDSDTGTGPPGSWHLDRASFDHEMLSHCAELGAEVRQGVRVVDVQQVDDGFVVETDGEPVHARQIVDASGRSRFLAHRWGLGLRRYDDMNNYAVYGYWEGAGQYSLPGDPLAEGESWAFVVTCDEGWIFFIPLAGGVTSVGLVSRRESLRDEGTPLDLYMKAVRGAPFVKDLLADATYTGPTTQGSDPERVSVVQDWSYRVEQVCGPGWYLIGDAALFIDPVLSSGLALASQGALQAANAITTLHRDPTVDREALLESYQSAYRDVAAAYYRTARVWYQRNLRADGWHGAARRERLRTQGGAALYESDADAFTAITLGAVCSPLDAVVSEASQDPWGSEFFAWLTADRLFANERVDTEGVSSSEEARSSSRAVLRQRWRRLVNAPVRLRAGEPRGRRGFHTNRWLETWEPIRYAELCLPDPVDDELRLVFASFEDRPTSILADLDGRRPIAEIVLEALEGYPIASKERDRRLRAFSECILQLDLLDLLEVPDVPPSLPGADHPLISLVAASVLRSLDTPAQVMLEVGFVGDRCAMTVAPEGQAPCWFHLYDATWLPRARGLPRTVTTGMQWPNQEEGWHNDFADAFLDRLRRHERGPKGHAMRSMWSRMRPLGGFGMTIEHVPGQPPVLAPR